MKLQRRIMKLRRNVLEVLAHRLSIFSASTSRHFSRSLPSGQSSLGCTFSKRLRDYEFTIWNDQGVEMAYTWKVQKKKKSVLVRRPSAITLNSERSGPSTKQKGTDKVLTNPVP